MDSAATSKPQLLYGSVSHWHCYKLKYKVIIEETLSCDAMNVNDSIGNLSLVKIVYYLNWDKLRHIYYIVCNCKAIYATTIYCDQI